MRHVRITLPSLLVCELKLVYCSSGPKGSIDNQLHVENLTIDYIRNKIYADNNLHSN